MLRWMMGGRMGAQEARKSLGVEEIPAVMRAQRLRWLGHVERRDKEAWVRKIQSLDCGGKRPRGRPRMTWRSVVEQDLRSWRMRLVDANDRDRWRSMLKSAMRKV